MSEVADPTRSPAVHIVKARNGFTYCHALRVRFRDCDAMRLVNNAVYFTYLEEARFGYWADAVSPSPGAGINYIVARNECDYESAAVAGEPPDVWVRTSSIGRSSFVLDYEIVAASDGCLVARGRTVQVMFDYAAGRTLPVPDELAATLERYEGRRLRR